MRCVFYDFYEMVNTCNVRIQNGTVFEKMWKGESGNEKGSLFVPPHERKDPLKGNPAGAHGAASPTDCISSYCNGISKESVYCVNRARKKSTNLL